MRCKKINKGRGWRSSLSNRKIIRHITLYRMIVSLPPHISPMLVKVLFSCSHSSPYMAFGLIHVQNFPCFPRQGRIDLEEPLGDILMCGRNYFERFLYLPLLPDLQSGSFHPVPGRPAASGKYPHFRPYPLQSYR